jgi:hypothetical protein
MTIKNIPFIAALTIDGSAGDSGFTPLNNFRIFGAAFTAPQGKTFTVTAKARNGVTTSGDEGGTLTPFFIKSLDGAAANGGAPWTEAPKEGKTLVSPEHDTQYIAVITADSLASGEYDRAAFGFEVDGGDVGAVALFLTDTRYSDVLGFDE